MSLDVSITMALAGHTTEQLPHPLHSETSMLDTLSIPLPGTMDIAPNGQDSTQVPHPTQRLSLTWARGPRLVSVPADRWRKALAAALYPWNTLSFALTG
jgi:hypothetical protein